MQHLLKISFIRNHLYSRAVEQFAQEQAQRGIAMRNLDVPERLSGVKTLLVDSQLVMRGENIVRKVAAPLEVCDVSRLKNQRAWMVLALGVSLGCEGYAPLENFTRELNFARERLLRQYPQAGILPYDDGRRMETTIHKEQNGFRSYAKGDPAAILAACTRVLDGKERPLEERDVRDALDAAARMEAEGMETLAFAMGWNAEMEGDFESDMVFLGIVGMGDIPVKESAWMMESLRDEGIRPVLYSAGDMSMGAVYATGVLRPNAGVVGSADFDGMEEFMLRKASREVDAYLGMDWRRREKLAKALRPSGMVGTLTREPETGGLIVALGNGAVPDVLMDRDDLRAVVHLFEDCRVLRSTYDVSSGSKNSVREPAVVQDTPAAPPRRRRRAAGGTASGGKEPEVP